MEGAIRRVALGAVLSAAFACSGSEGGEGEGSACPEGTTRRESINEFAEPAPDSREEAVRVELENHGMSATDEAIAAAVIAAGPGGNAGTEEVEVETSEGVRITMTLKPLDPGWTVEGSTWCAPNPY